MRPSGKAPASSAALASGTVLASGAVLTLGVILVSGITLASSGCASGGSVRSSPLPPVKVPESVSPDLTSVTDALDLMRALPSGDSAKQAEIFEVAKAAADTAPTPTHRLNYALALATPGHAGADAVAARRQLSEVLATPETLLPAQRLLATVELQDVEQRLILQSENSQLRDEAPRESRDKLTALNKRLAAESDENVRLHKALDEAQAKLDAVTHIERSINDHGAAAAHP